jgi:hypothetical protein
VTTLAEQHVACDHPAWCAVTGLGDPEAAPVRRVLTHDDEERVVRYLTGRALAPETELERRARDGDR